MRFPFPFRRRPAPPARHLIVGLGNPGAEYEPTRHNVGFHVIDRLAERHRIELRRREKQAIVGRGKIGGTEVLLAMPQTYMNLSGESAAPLMRMLGLQPQDVIVITDDMDLPPGRIRIRPDGSAGGHNGLKSLIARLGTDEFPRVRVGVGRPPAGVSAADHVLSPFHPEERPTVRESIDRAADAVEAIVTDGLQAAMNRFNRREEE